MRRRAGAEVGAKRTAALGLVVFVAFLAIRLPRVDSPRPMIFDELLYARAGAEYLAGNESSEWTHPPLGKLLIAGSLRAFAAVGTIGSGRAPTIATIHGSDAVWIDRGVVRRGAIGQSCDVVGARSSAVGFDVRAVDLDGATVVAAGDGALRREGGPRLKLPGVATHVAATHGSAIVVLEGGQAVLADASGQVITLGGDARSVASSPLDAAIWVAYVDRVVEYDVLGSGRPRREIALDDVTGPIALAVDPTRGRVPHAFALAVGTNRGTAFIDTFGGQVSARTPARAASMASTTSGLMWLASGRSVDLVEPMSGSRIGGVHTAQPPGALIADPDRNRVIAATSGLWQCLGERAATAWRLPSVLAGALLGALTVLIALRLGCSTLAAVVAAALLGLEGMTFVLSRMANIEIVVTAFVAGAWWCALGWRASRRAGWLCGAAMCIGAAISTKWNGIWAGAVIGVLLLIWTRRAGVRAMGKVSAVWIAIPAAIYAVSFSAELQRSGWADWLRLQQRMIRYHTSYGDFHLLSSRWSEWPLGQFAMHLNRTRVNTSQSDVWIIANPVVVWAGFIAVVAFMIRGARLRDQRAGIVAAMWLTAWLPWALVTRATFLYHLLGAMPALVIAAGQLAARRRASAVILVVVAAVVFAVLYPMLASVPVDASYGAGVRRLGSWMFRVPNAP